MIKLQGHSITPGDRFVPESMTLNLAERTSTASMKIAPGSISLTVGDWLMDNTEPGKGIIWRVKTIETDYGGKTLTVTLEHIIATLKDTIMFGEIKPEDMGGDEERCYAVQAMQYILSRQGVWQYGGCEYDIAEEYNFNSDTLYDALETVSGSLPDCWWEYDLSVYPFKLYIRHQSSSTVSEMRMSRNISTIRKTIDRSRMYTRFYPIGKDDLHIDGDYVSRNESTWGTVCKTETNTALDTDSKLRSWAWERLNRHCEPAVTISISGLDLSAATGESLDHIRLGGLCQVPLPEYGTTITERITKITFKDKISEPETITVTLSNEQEDIASIINNINKTSSSGGRSGAKNSGEDHAWFIDTESHVGMIAEAIVGQGSNGVDWSRVASIIVDGYGIHDRVVLAEGEIVLLQSEIEITESHWRATFEDNMNSLRSEIEMSASHLRTLFVDEVTSLRGEMEVTASHLRTEFTDEAGSIRSELEQTASQIRSEVASEAGSIRSEITQTASSIRSEVANTAQSIRSEVAQTASSWSAKISGVTDSNGNVTAASIAVAINNSTGESEAKVDAQHVYIGNDKSTTVISGKCSLSDVTANYISGKIAELSVLSVAAISATGNISTSNGVVMAPYFYLGTAGNTKNLAGAIQSLKVVQVSGSNDYKIQKMDFDDGDWVDVPGTFSRAVASWTMGWSNGTFTAKANPQNQSCSTTITQGTATWDGNTATVPINAADSDNPNYSYATGRSILVDASARYTAGETAGYNGCHLTSSWGSGSESNKLLISKTTSGSSNSLSFTITAGASISFSSSTNKFTASGKAKVDGTEKDNASASSGALSISFNSLQGSGASAYRTASVKEGSTAIITSGNLTDYGDGYTAGYNAGWNAACTKVTRSGNKIYGPVSGKATASSGQTEVKFTANYTASSYTKETHSYKASSHSFSQAICKTNGTNHTKYYYNANFSGTIDYTPATDSYTASTHSYTASSYTASSHSYTASSYTASSFSWS